MCSELAFAVCAAIVILPVSSVQAETTSRADIANGKYLTAAAGCQACHTAEAEGSVPFAGGRALKTSFGIFYSPNITPDRDTGIGTWGETDFIKALKQGVSPTGNHYFPAFPFTSYTKMSDQDSVSIFAYLRSLPKARRQNRAHDVTAPFSWRWLQAGWKLLFFKEGDFVPDVGVSEDINRGGYLVQALGHCGECHTSRNALGGRDMSMSLAGAVTPGDRELAANITPDNATGIGEWTQSELADFLETGMKPDFDNVQGSMEQVIRHGTSKLNPRDRTAMADYLLSLPAISNKIEKKK